MSMSHPLGGARFPKPSSGVRFPGDSPSINVSGMQPKIEVMDADAVDADFVEVDNE